MKAATLKKIDGMNAKVISTLQSPFHWLLSPGLMVIKITGRKTGRQYSIPVGYHDQGDIVIVLVSDAANRKWWRNFQGEGDIEMIIKSKTMTGRAQVLEPGSDEYKLRAEQSFSRNPFISKIFGIKFDKKSGLTPEQLEKLASYAAIVRINKNI